MPETLPYSSVAGGIPHGSRIVTIDGVAYIADSFQVTAPTKQLSQNNHLGADARFKLIAARKTATATLQLETASTTLPGRGREFDGEAADEVAKWVITEVGVPYQADAITLVNITCWAK